MVDQLSPFCTSFSFIINTKKMMGMFHFAPKTFPQTSPFSDETEVTNRKKLHQLGSNLHRCIKINDETRNRIANASCASEKLRKT